MKKLIIILTFLSVSLMVLAQEPKTRTKRDTSASESVRVPRETPSPEIILSQTTLELFEKENDFGLTARIKNARADTPSVVWTSSKPAVATVDATGKIKALTSGKTMVIATLQGITSAQCEVIVLKANRQGNSNAALIDGGMVASQNNWIYYANPYDSLKLYKIKLDGSEKTKLCNDKPNQINVVGRTIYYQNTNKETKSGLYMIGIDGSQRTLINDLDYMLYMRVFDYSIVYLNQDHEVYRLTAMNLDKAKQKYFDEKELTAFSTDDYYCYYSGVWEGIADIGGLYIYDIKKKKKEQLMSNYKRLTKFIVDDGWIYYFLNEVDTRSTDGKEHKGTKGLYKINIRDENSPDPYSKMAPRDKLLLEYRNCIYKGKPYEYWTVSDNWIYYIDYSEYAGTGAELRRKQTDGKMDQNVKYISKVDNNFAIYPIPDYLLLCSDNQFIRMGKDGRNALELK
jgi:hypothetical protein